MRYDNSRSCMNLLLVCEINDFTEPRSNCFLAVNYLMSLKVKRFVRSSTIVLEGDSLLRPIIKMQAGFAERGKSKLTMGVYYNRTSALFQV